MTKGTGRVSLALQSTSQINRASTDSDHTDHEAKPGGSPRPGQLPILASKRSASTGFGRPFRSNRSIHFANTVPSHSILRNSSDSTGVQVVFVRTTPGPIRTEFHGRSQSATSSKPACCRMRPLFVRKRFLSAYEQDQTARELSYELRRGYLNPLYETARIRLSIRHFAILFAGCRQLAREESFIGTRSAPSGMGGST